jgi:protein-L-isoaspartate O-methyltransferase
MDWITDFYLMQQQLGDVYSGPVLEYHRKDAASVVALLNAGKKVLELGAGGGQRAAALAELGCEVTASEFQSGAVAHAQRLQAALPSGAGSLSIHAADFYTLELQETFDAVC